MHLSLTHHEIAARPNQSVIFPYPPTFCLVAILKVESKELELELEQVIRFQKSILLVV